MHRRHIEDFVNPLQPATIYELSFGDKDLPPLISSAEILALLNFATARGAWVRNVEAYRLKDGLEYPAIEHGIYGVPATCHGMSVSEKITFMADEVKAILGDISEEADPFGFIVWLDQTTRN